MTMRDTEFSGYPYYLHNRDEFAQYWRDYFQKYPMDSTDSIGLYIDFPFCQSICKFCAFGSCTVKGHEDEIKMYQKAVLELAMSCYGILPKLNNVYFGGGTPSLWDPAMLQEILTWVDVYHDAYIRTMEVHPRDLNKDFLKTIDTMYDISTVSIGVQSFDKDTCTRQNRQWIHPGVLKTYTDIMRSWMIHTNVDLIALMDDDGEHGWDVFVNDLKTLADRIHPDDICLCVNFRNPNYYMESIRLRAIIRSFLREHPEYNIEHPESLSLDYDDVVKYEEEVYHIRLATYHRLYKAAKPTVMTRDREICKKNTVVAFGGNRGHCALSFAGRNEEMVNSAYNASRNDFIHTVTPIPPDVKYDGKRIPTIGVGHINIKGGEPMAKVALINYYARLLRKKVIAEQDIPADYHDLVMEAFSKLPPLPSSEGT
ncbi:MAG: hypothetical protein NC131_11300 [Roseburia sp.]|nr:hypothetical protein [Roseburia sp.]